MIFHSFCTPIPAMGTKPADPCDGERVPAPAGHTHSIAL